ncbi:MAG: Gfo/Idh/MocA family oxidoreductase [Ignavibacteria bacterium]|nr:Gfo/Idh/MocA family oxidoreductase [Ignavibacteria bacterium]
MNFLIFGLGSIGRRHAGILSGIEGNKIFACRTGKSGIKSSEKFPYTEIDQSDNFADHNIDGALITNPTSMHIETALKIAEYGIPLFIEKPLGNELHDVKRLQEITKEKNIPVLMGYNFLHHSGIKLIKKLIKENKIGKVISAKSQFGTYMPDWHKDEDYKKSYASNSVMGGGVILTSIHEQNYLTDLFGEVTEVKAMKTGGNILDIKAEEGAEILMRHEGGVVSNIHLNFYQKPYYRNCQVIGTEGTIYWDFLIPAVKILYKDKTEIIKTGKGAFELLDESYTEQMQHFTEVIKGNSKPAADLYRGVKDLETALEILKQIN